MNRRFLVLIVIVVVALSAAGPFYAIFNSSNKPEQRIPAVDNASLAAKAFFDGYVTSEGKVGKGDLDLSLQANALLIAAATADRSRFDAIWKRIQADLVAPDGTFIAGHVASQPATPARVGDLLVVARAHLVAAQRLNDAGYQATAANVAAAIIEHNYRALTNGGAVLVDNPTTSSTSVLEVSAASMQLRTIDEISKLDGADPRWKSIAAGQRALAHQQMDDKKDKLPMDRVELSDTGQLIDHTGASYGPAAQTIPLAFKDSCNATDKTYAKRIWQTLRQSPKTRAAASLASDGSVIDDKTSVKGLVATAATAQVAEESVQALTLLDQADATAKQQGTAEAQAWATIGRIVTSTDWLGPC